MKPNPLIKRLCSVFVTGFMIVLTGCSLWQKSATQQAWLKPGVDITLPSPRMSMPLKRQQFLTVTVNGKSDSLLTLLDVEDNRLTLAGLSPLGIRVFKASYTQAGIETEQSIVLPQLPPINQVLADIMLSYWPISDWQPLLPPGWQLKDRENRRLLLDANGTLITEIHYHVEHGYREPISIAQYAFNYHISILNVEN